MHSLSLSLSSALSLLFRRITARVLVYAKRRRTTGIKIVDCEMTRGILNEPRGRKRGQFVPVFLPSQLFPRADSALPLRSPLLSKCSLPLFSPFSFFILFSFSFSSVFPPRSSVFTRCTRLTRPEELNFKIRHRDEFHCSRGVARIDLTLASAPAALCFFAPSPPSSRRMPCAEC